MDQVPAGHQSVVNDRPGWYCLVGNVLYAWSYPHWVYVATLSKATSSNEATSGDDESPVLWYWNGQKWIVPGEEGAPDSESDPKPRYWLVLVGLVAIMGLDVLIGDRLDWAVCPGQNCNEGRTLEDSWPEGLVVGLTFGGLITVFEWLWRREKRNFPPQKSIETLRPDSFADRQRGV